MRTIAEAKYDWQTRDGNDVWRYRDWQAQCCGCICTVCEEGHAWQVERNQHHPECTELFIETQMNLDLRKRWRLARLAADALVAA